MQNKMILSAAALVASMALVGCDLGVDDPVSSSVSETCAPVPISCNGNIVEACANSSSGGWYEVNGSRVCNYTVSTASCAQLVVDRYCSRPEAREEMIELLSAKSENLDLQNKVNDLMDVINQDIVDSQQDTAE
jgi:hypothetical protein